MTDQRRNAEHYMDMTAYLAIQNAERELGMLPKKGEIWSVDYSGEERMVVVIAAHSSFCTVTLLNNEPRNDTDIKITVGSAMYTNPAMLGYRFNNLFIERIQSMPEDEFEDLLDSVAQALCIETVVYENQSAMEKLKSDNDRLRLEIERLEATQTEGLYFDKENIRLKAERDLFKELYEQTFAKLIIGR